MRHALGGVDEHLGADLVRSGDDVFKRVANTQNVGGMDHADEFCTLKSVMECVHIECEMLGDGHVAKFHTSLLCEHLPGNNIGMVLHLGQDDGVALGQVRTTPSMGDEVDGLGRAAGDDDFVSVEASLEFAAAGFVAFGCFTCEGVNGSVDVGVGFGVVIIHRVQDDLRLLCGRSVVQIDQRIAVNLTLQNRELITE